MTLSKTTIKFAQTRNFHLELDELQNGTLISIFDETEEENEDYPWCSYFLRDGEVKLQYSPLSKMDSNPLRSTEDFPLFINNTDKALRNFLVELDRLRD